MNITLLYSPAPRHLEELSLDVPTGCTLEAALERSGWVGRYPELPKLTAGVWGRKAEPQTPLREGDRVEFYRELRVDPKVARRERFAGQGARGAGLFSRRRPGSKAGY